MVALLVNVTCVNQAFAARDSERKVSKSEKKIKKHALKVKAGVEKLGTGKEAVVKVKTRDKQEFTGYVSDISQDGFTIVDANGIATTIDYENAKQIKGNNLHSGAWIAIGAGLTVLVFVIVLFVLKAKNE